ncbi:hypothetical protein JCM10296v2_000634 [Rhodotorula toruloides]
MPGPPRLPLDPYPQFLLSSLDFDLDNLDRLHPYQLALVHFSPLATPEQRLRADVLWWQRRREAIEGCGEEFGLSEASAGLRQMKRAREWLEGRVPGSKKMRDAGVQTDPPPAPPPTTPQPAVTPPTPAPVHAFTQSSPTVGSVPSSNPTATRPSFDFSFESNEPCPPALHSQFHILWCGDIATAVTPALFLFFLVRRTRNRLPRFFALRRASSGAFLLAFRSSDDAHVAQQDLDGEAVPHMKCRINAVVRGNSGSEFKWRDLSVETRQCWTMYRSLPRQQLVDQAKPAGKGITVSQDYHDELQRIKDAEEQDERRLADEAREATLKWRRDNWGGDYDGHSDSCESCPPQYDLTDDERVESVLKIINDSKAAYPDVQGPVWRPILKSPVLRSFVRAYGFTKLGLRADQMPWYRPPPPPTAPPTPPPGPPPPQQSPAQQPPPPPQPRYQHRPPPQPPAPRLPSRPTFTPSATYDSYPSFAFGGGTTAAPTNQVPRPGPSSSYPAGFSLPYTGAIIPNIVPPAGPSHTPVYQPYDFGGWTAQKRGAGGDQTTDPRKRARYDAGVAYGRT